MSSVQLSSGLTRRRVAFSIGGLMIVGIFALVAMMGSGGLDSGSQMSAQVEDKIPPLISVGPSADTNQDSVVIRTADLHSLVVELSAGLDEARTDKASLLQEIQGMSVRFDELNARLSVRDEKIESLAGQMRKLGKSEPSSHLVAIPVTSFQNVIDHPIASADYAKHELVVPVEPATVLPEAPSLESPQPNVDQLLTKAASEFASNKLTIPANKNAWETYQNVLVLAPGNLEAVEGIAKIHRKYMRWGKVAEQRGSINAARRNYQSILKIAPGDHAAEQGLTRLDSIEARAAVIASAGTIFEYAERGDAEAVSGILQAGEAVDKIDENGLTPLLLAAIHGHEQIVGLLLEAGAVLNRKTGDGRTALLAAAWNGHSEVVIRLVEAGADVNIQSEQGWTPLLMAAWNGYVPVVQSLLERNADVTITNEDSWTALSAASSEQHSDIVLLLQQATVQ